MRFRHLPYVLTVTYSVGVFLVYVIVRAMPPESQVAAILVAIPALLILTGANLLATYADIRNNRFYYEQLAKKDTPHEPPGPAGPSTSTPA